MRAFDTGPIARLRTIYTNRYEPEYSIAFANLYWRTLLSLACLIVIASCAYGAWQFFGVLADVSPVVPVSTPTAPQPAALDKKTLDATLASFDSRKASFQILETAPVPTLPDPSK